MASSRIISTRSQRVFMAHICSECGFPMITAVQIEAEAQKVYTFSQSKAEDIANETARNAIKKEIQKIESCYSTKQPLNFTQKGSGMIGYGHFCTSSLSGFFSYCPKCLNIEPWKSTSSKKRMDELEKENFPVVFKYLNEAEMWASNKVRGMIDSIITKRENCLEVERAISEVKKMNAKILILEHQMNSFPEQEDFDVLNKELLVAKEQKECLGLFDFKEKKNLSERIKTLEQQVIVLKETLDKKIRPIAREIVTLGNELLIIQAIAFGCSDKVVSEQKGNSYSYFLSPNEVPGDIMEEIENQVARTLNNKQTVHVGSEILVEESECREDAVYCRKCGFKLLPDSSFCTKCGSKVD